MNEVSEWDDKHTHNTGEINRPLYCAAGTVEFVKYNIVFIEGSANLSLSLDTPKLSTMPFNWFPHCCL